MRGPQGQARDATFESKSNLGGACGRPSGICCALCDEQKTFWSLHTLPTVGRFRPSRAPPSLSSRLKSRESLVFRALSQRRIRKSWRGASREAAYPLRSTTPAARQRRKHRKA